MSYPVFPNLSKIAGNILDYGQLMHEYGAQNIQALVDEAEQSMKSVVERLKKLPIDPVLAAAEPNDLEKIHSLRPDGSRKIWKSFNETLYKEKLEGSMLARFAGCTLGAVVEFWPVADMEEWAKQTGDPFPPKDYWSYAKKPFSLHYGKSKEMAYTRDGINGVPVDDDITYTLLGLLIAEDYGIDFTVDDVGKAWLKYLPYACTAEDVALRNLKNGIPASQTAEINNPFCQWIGADIRSDPWAYMAPAWPEKAAEMAYRDAYLSHRRNGIYGEMFFSAVQAAAFAVDNAADALEIGLTEIPKDCLLSGDVRWALTEGRNIKNYKDARQAVDERFKDMSGVHTNNNACLTIFGLMIGERDVTKVISETVAMGLDNDCTAATAGSIAGAIVGRKGIPEHWYKNFNNKVLTYLIDREEFEMNDLVRRFCIQAKNIYHQAPSL
jgi:ADP-ribosylglycohydrolase